jgi:hypothetical protein
MYNPKPGEQAYRLTRRLANGRDENLFFPVTDKGLGDALREWRSGRSRRGQQHGAIEQVTVGYSNSGKA